MVKKSSGQREAGVKGAHTRRSGAAGREPAETRLIRWLESDEPLLNLGHGVQFLHDDLPSDQVVAFLEGFEWLHRRDSPVTVKLLRSCPSYITVDHWREVIQNTREGVLAFLSHEGKRNGQFRHGPVHIIVNG